MMKLKFWKKRKTTPEENLIASFFEDGRWAKGEDTWTDTKTGAVLTFVSRGIFLNDVHQSMDVYSAAWEIKYLPTLLEEAAKRKALEDLYANNT